MTFFSRFARLLPLITLLFISFSFAQSGTPNVPLLVNVNQYGSTGYNDCWGYTANGREYALLGVLNGTSVIDITDTNNPVEIGFIPSTTSTWKDIKTYQHYAYVVNESGGGMQILDLSDLPNSVSLATTYNGFSTSHNIYIDVTTGILLSEGSAGQSVRTISLANPLSPVQLSSFGIECHDIYLQDNIAYVSEGFSGSLGIFDLTNPASPSLLTRLNIPAAGYVHNAWTTADGHYVMTTEETGGKTIKLWDVSDLSNITLTDQILGPSGLAHNTHIKGNYAYVSHYADGLRIYDISDPYDIVEAGYYDTYPSPSSGFDGAWGAYPFYASGKILISDRTTGLYVVYFEGAAEGDPLDPDPPANLAAYSDYTTPSSISLTWNDPTNYFNGDTLLPGDFTIEIERDGAPVASVAAGNGQYSDGGLNDGQLYQYAVYAKVTATDSTSQVVEVEWHAGGSPVPAAPDNLAGTGSAVAAVLTWSDPATQSDGTPLDDLAEIRIYRNGVQVATVAPGTESYTDNPPLGFTYAYTVTAADNENPVNETDASNAVQLFVGSTPAFLVWVGPDAAAESAESGDSLFAALLANGESAFLSNDLFEFGADLSIYEGIFVVLGIFSNNHVIGSGDPEGPALQAYLQNGGRLYLEGGDCFNYDPEVGGYNIRPWFDLDDGPDGSGDLSGITGQNDLSAFSFSYNGENNWMDELQPLGSTPVWKNNGNTDISGVFNPAFGSGSAIGVVPSFGGLVDNSAPLGAQSRPLSAGDVIRRPGEKTLKNRPEALTRKPFAKKAGWYPERKKDRKMLSDLLKITPRGIEILAGTKAELMAAYLALLGYSGGPQLFLSPTEVLETVPPGASSTRSVTVVNTGSSSGEDLMFTVAENPPADWLTVTPESDTLNAGSSADLTLSFDAAALGIGTYSTTLEVSSNDPANPLATISVELTVEGVAVLTLQHDSLAFDTVTVGQNASRMVYVYNTGSGALNVSDIIASDPAFSADHSAFSLPAGDSLALTVTFAPAMVGDYSGELKIVSNAAAADTARIYLHGTGGAMVGIGSGVLPETFAVGQNYPNPFNPTTRIDFQVPAAGAVELTIYNMLGQKVRTLVEQPFAPGYYHAEWDGRNDLGAPVSSGIYLYRFQAGAFQAVRKMIFMK